MRAENKCFRKINVNVLDISQPLNTQHIRRSCQISQLFANSLSTVVRTNLRKSKIQDSEMNTNDCSKESWCWTPESTQLMLDLYLERKEKFLDPTLRKKSLWQEICVEMEKVGYTGLTIDTLDRKLRNMRKTYRTIKEYNKISGKERKGWKYYATFDEHFNDDWPPNKPPNISYFEDTRTRKKQTKISSIENYAPTKKRATISSFEEITCSMTPEAFVDETSSNSEDTCDQRKTLIELEIRHIKAIEILTEKVQEANDIQRERNKLLEQFIYQLK